MPTMARYHRELLDTHIESAEIAILPFTEAGGEQSSAGLRHQLLKRAGADAVMLKRPEQRELFLVPGHARNAGPHHRSATTTFCGTKSWKPLDCLFAGGDRDAARHCRPTQIRGAETVEIDPGRGADPECALAYSDSVPLLVGC